MNLFQLALLTGGLLLFSGNCALAQEEPRVIRFKKESDLAKAVFDNTRLQLIVIDRFGNPRDNRILSFSLYVKSSRETKAFRGYGNDLSADMINYLNKQKKAVKIFFTEITAVDNSEHPVKLPDVIDTWFPDCGNCDREKRIRR